jgi:hypothetical protein
MHKTQELAGFPFKVRGKLCFCPTPPHYFEKNLRKAEYLLWKPNKRGIRVRLNTFTKI